MRGGALAQRLVNLASKGRVQKQPLRNANASGRLCTLPTFPEPAIVREALCIGFHLFTLENLYEVFMKLWHS